MPIKMQEIIHKSGHCERLGRGQPSEWNHRMSNLKWIWLVHFQCCNVSNLISILVTWLEKGAIWVLKKSFNFDLAGGTPFRIDSPSLLLTPFATFGASREKLRHQQLQTDILKREMVDLIAENDEDMRDLLEFLHGELS